MTKRASAKYKLDRRMGENIWGRNKSPVSKRAYGPGQHGQRKSRKLSDYGTQLHAKQKLKGYYANITERQFRRYYEEAARRTGDTGEHMIGLLERRLDAIVFRAKFVPTPFAARQLVSHGHVAVNGKRVTIPSYLVKEGDTLELRGKAKDMALVLEAVEEHRARSAGLYRGQPRQDDGEVPAHAQARRRALRRADAAEPRGRVLLAVTQDCQSIEARGSARLGAFSRSSA